MAVAGRGCRIAVPEQTADHRQAVSGANQLARKTVPQIVNAQSADAGGFAKLSPCVPNVAAVMGSIATAGEYVFFAAGFAAHPLDKQHPRRCGQLALLSFFLLAP